ncbi:TPA: hypothetical protein ACH3X1_009740 [Trebouxia sp. C0004]
MTAIDPTIAAVLQASHLNEETKRVYAKNLSMIHAAAGYHPVLLVLTKHPQKVIEYITRKYSEVASQKILLVSIMAVYRLLDLKTKARSSYALYLDYFDEMDAILRERSKTNLPSKRQAEGFVTHAELQQVRRGLPAGSNERLLLNFYGGCIPPVRNDLHSAFIHRLTCKDGKAQDAVMNSITTNCILLPYDNKEGVLILREFKTQDKANPKLYNRRLGAELSNELRLSLQQRPRDFLFREAGEASHTHMVAFSNLLLAL